jgi:hypothetical protein
LRKEIYCDKLYLLSSVIYSCQELDPAGSNIYVTFSK